MKKFTYLLVLSISLFFAGGGILLFSDILINYEEPETETEVINFEDEESGFTFAAVVNGGNATIKGFRPGFASSVTNLVIPETITYLSLENEMLVETEYTVTGIAANAFQNSTEIQTVVIPDTVTTIGATAFAGCTGINSMTLPVVTTRFYEFFGTSQSSHGISSSLKTVNVTSALANTIPSYYFMHGCASVELITIPEGITNIERSAFSGCYGLKSITIPTSVTSIGYQSFYNCTGLVEINFNATNCNDTELNNPFYYSSSSTVVATCVLNIGANVTRIPAYLFRTCKILKQVNWLGGGLNCTEIGNYAFSGCSKLTSITIPENVMTFGGGKEDSYSFDGCTDLTEINWNAISGPDFGQGTNHFRQAGQSGSGITLNIGVNVTRIPGCAFYCYSSSGNINFPKINTINFLGSKVTNIGSMSFGSIESLTTVHIPASVLVVGDTPAYGGYVFGGCTNLASITVAAANPNYSTDGRTLFNKVGTIMYLYASGSGSSYAIPNSVEAIMDFAFYNCTGLLNVNIPDSVKALGQHSFSGCTGLEEVIINKPATSGLPFNGMTAFSNSFGLYSGLPFTNANFKIIVPDATSATLYKAAANWSNYASKIYAMP